MEEKEDDQVSLEVPTACTENVHNDTVDSDEEYGKKWRECLNSSKEALFAACIKQLHIGHWELFRALCMTVLSRSDIAENKYFVLNILRKLYDRPEALCKNPKLLETPKIFWLCAQFYAEISDDKDEANLLLSDAGYRNTLWEVYEESTKDYVKELHTTHLLLLKGCQIDSTELTPSTKKFLVNLLHSKPKIGVEILEPLLQKSKYDNFLPELLLCLYQSLEHCLAKLELIFSSAFNSEISETTAVDTESVYLQLTLCEYFDVLYSKDLCSDKSDSYGLNVYHPRQDSNLNIDIDRMLMRVWNLCEKGVLDKISIYFSLLSHRDPWMIRRLCYLEDQAKNRFKLENANLSAENFLRLVYNHRTGELNFKELFLYSFINKQHFLENIVSSSIELLSSGEHLLVCGLLKDPVLCRLKPLIMLLLWTRVKTIPEVVKFVDMYEILYMSDMPADPQLNLACKQLVSKAKLVLWACNNVCRKKRMANDRDTAEFLTNLPQHSALYILHHCADLDQRDSEQVTSILKDWSWSRELSPDKSEDSIRNELLRDQMILHSYYIMFDFVQVIHAGMRFDQLIEEGRRDLKKAETEGAANTKDGTDCQQEELRILKNLNEFYTSNVFHPLKMLIQKLDALFPLTYRVEIMENAFSLLFLTRKNLMESSSGSSPGSSDEGYEGVDDVHSSNHTQVRDLKSISTYVLESISQDYGEKKLERCQSKHGKDEEASKHQSRKAKWKQGTIDVCQSSENASSISGGSGGSSLNRIGFIVNEFVVRDMLECLHQCAINTSAMSVKDGSSVNYLTNAVESSVNEKTLSRRLSTLLYYITEAQWRFQLVADEWIPKEFGIFPTENLFGQQHLCNNWSYQFYEEPLSEDKKDSSALPKSVGTGVSSSESASPAEQRKRTALKRRKTSSASARPNKAFFSKDIISKMLASHDSLLITCLQQNELTKAKHIIQIFGMEHTPMAAEVEFALDYEKAVHQLSNSSPTKMSRSLSRSGTRSSASAWESIVEAAQSGMDAASAETLVADELLASHKVPGIAEIDKLECKGQLAAYLPEQIDWRALVRTDLALVACDKIHACRSLLESAYASLRGSSTSVSPIRTSRTKTSNVKGIPGFIEDIISLISPELRATMDLQGMVEFQLSESRGVRDLLLQASCPISAKAYQKKKVTWGRIGRVFEKLRKLMEEESAVSQGEQSYSPQSLSISSNVQDHSSSGHPIHGLYRRLMKYASALKMSVEEELSIRSRNAFTPQSKPFNDVRYLAMLYDYVKNLSTIVPQFHQESLMVGGSYFTALQYSPSSILERLLITNAMPPSELEEFSKKLNLNLMEIIIRLYCPFIPAKGCCSQAEKCSGEENALDPSEQFTATPEGALEKKMSNPSLDELASPTPSKISKELLSYVEEKCWMLAVLMRAIGCVPENDGESDTESYHGDSEILHPVLHRFLERRCSSTIAPVQPSFALCPDVSLERIELVMKRLTENERWHDALEYLNSWECHSVKFQKEVHCYRNLVLAKLAVLSLGCEDKSWRYVLQMSDDKAKVEIVLEHYFKWSADGALAALHDCCAIPSLDSEIRLTLQQHLAQVRLYEMILQKLMNEELKLDLDDASQALIVWQDVARIVKENTYSLIRSLFKSRQYSVILKISDLHLLPEELKQFVDDSYVLSLLEEFEINPTTVLKALGRAQTAQQRLTVCQKVLEFISNTPTDFTLLLHLLETADLNGVNEVELEQYLSQKVGVKIFYCVLAAERDSYIDLIMQPDVMIEQLLINIKIETLQTAFQTIRADLKSFSNNSKISFDAINTILEVYASKAVDFRVVPMIISGGFRHNVQSTTVFAPKRVPFVMPSKVPSKQQWVPDASVLQCMVCSVEIFSMFNRRHHCRRCGRVVCATCSQKRKQVQGYGDVPVRICDECFEQSASLSLSRSSETLETRVKAHLTASGSMDNSPRACTTLPILPSDSTPEAKKKVVWKMSLDPTHNKTTREEFSYEEAPSISLCLSICDLHWDQHRSGQYLLNLAHTLFKYLQPISPGVSNPEIDYSLVISMLKSVLLSAKVKFSKTFDNDAVSRCDQLLGLADVCKLLVSSNCKHLIPPISTTSNDVIRELRDKLMKEERWNLALEISTKGGLDVMGVWSAWGMICLRMGYYSVAREKFSHCLQRIKDKNKVGHSNPLLEQILKQLENACCTYDTKENAITASLARLKHIKNGTIQKAVSLDFARLKLDPKIRDECIYYIETYGSHAANLSFYVRHNEWENALKYANEKNCLALSFIEEIIMPSLRKGRFTEVKFAMRRLDPSLWKWESYFDPLCRHFQRSGLFHVLYDWQKFLKDDIRCAMTCIHFYQQGAGDYSELNDRLPHLQQAIQHLKNYKQHYDGSGLPSSKKIRLHLPLKDIDKYINAIALQTEITHYVNERLMVWLSVYHKFTTMSSNAVSSVSQPSLLEDNLDAPNTSVPTVFGDLTERAHVVLMVILCGMQLSEGFELAVRIIKEFSLPSTNIYLHIARNLIKLQRSAEIPLFLNCMKRIGGQENDICDKVLLKAIRVSLGQGDQYTDTELLVKLISDDKNKIDAFILCGKLKSAYLLAVKGDNVESVRKICVEAEKSGQILLKTICEKWLDQKHQKATPSV